MYSLSTRFNVVLYNMMMGMIGMGALNFLSGYYSTHNIENASFTLGEMDTFKYYKYLDEQAASFKFDMKADISDLFNWNTNIIFLSVVCEFETEHSKKNAITIWDQRIMRESEEFYKLDLKEEWVEYYLTDITQSLKDKDVSTEKHKAALNFEKEKT